MAQRGPRTHPAVRDYIRRRVLEGATAADLIKIGPPESLAEHWPQSPRTIQSLVKRYRPAPVDPSEAWTLHPDAEEDPRPILAALRALIEFSKGRRRQITREQARWIAAVARAVPTMSGEDLLTYSALYLRAAEEGWNAPELEQALAFGGANSPDYLSAQDKGWVNVIGGRYVFA